METIGIDLGSIFSDVVSRVDVMYILLCNIVVYLVIKAAVIYRKKDICNRNKTTIAAVTAIVLAYLMTAYYEHNVESVFYGFFMQFLTYDYIFNPILKRIRKYNKDNESNEPDNDERDKDKE